MATKKTKVMHIAIKDMASARFDVSLLTTHKHLTGKTIVESNKELRQEGYKLRNKKYDT